MAEIQFSGIRRVVERAAELERAGRSIVHFEIGRPYFDTPAHVKQAAIDALSAGDVHYASNYGTPSLRLAIARKLKRENELSYSPNGEIIVTVGANEAVLLAFMASWIRAMRCWCRSGPGCTTAGALNFAGRGRCLCRVSKVATSCRTLPTWRRVSRLTRIAS